MVLQIQSEQCIFLSVFESRARSLLTFTRQEWTERALFCPPSPGPAWCNLALAQELLIYPFVMQAGYQVLGFPSAEAVWRAHKPVCNIMDGFSSQPQLLPGHNTNPHHSCLQIYLGRYFRYFLKHKSSDSVCTDITFFIWILQSKQLLKACIKLLHIHK